MSLHSAACCSVPPVVAKNYDNKGKFIEVDGLKTYVTGKADAKKAILIIYDVFGFSPQLLQGIDILAYGDHEQSYKIFIPDFLEGSYAQGSWFPPDTEEKGKALGSYFSGPAAPGKTADRLQKVIEALKKGEASGISDWGVVGYCWGAKIVNLTSQEGSPFKAAATAHPSMVDPADAAKVTIPIATLPSKDEDKDAINKYQQALKVKNVVEWFPTQVHGWMAARANLEDDEVKKEYERGYKLLLDWFHENL